MQTGVNIAGVHCPPGAQTITAQVEPLQFVAHMPAPLHVIDASAVLALAFFLAASDGAAEIAIAMTATVPTSRSLAIDFMVRVPPLFTK
jgi:hypothetical protein